MLTLIWGNVNLKEEEQRRLKMNRKYIEEVILQRLRGSLGTGAFERKVEEIQKSIGFAETVLAFNEILS